MAQQSDKYAQQALETPLLSSAKQPGKKEPTGDLSSRGGTPRDLNKNYKI